jgi:hypothetical protein
VNEFKGKGCGDQDYNHPFKDFHPAIRGLVRDLFIDTFQGLELAQNARVPFIEVEPFVYQPINPR